MTKRISNLPSFISTKYGLPDKCHELNRNMPMCDRIDGMHVEYQEGTGVVLNRKTGATLGRYVTVDYNKYKLVIA